MADESIRRGLFDQFLVEPDIATRARIAQAAIGQHSPDEAISRLFAELNVAVDHLRTVLEIVVNDTHLSSADLMDKIRQKTHIRSADYLEFQFNSIVADLEEERFDRDDTHRPNNSNPSDGRK